MNRSSFDFDRPKELGATAPPEERGLERDGVRLLVRARGVAHHRTFRDLPELLTTGDLLVVNESATVAASLPAHGPNGDFLLNLSTEYGDGVWLAEARWGTGRPGPVPMTRGVPVEAGGAEFHPIGPFPGIERLWFFSADGDVPRAMQEHGRPIRYGYVRDAYPLDRYQTIFARVPGSAEMPSAGRPFTPSVVRGLTQRGVAIAPIVLHAGVSSLEGEPDSADIPPIYPEPFEVPRATADRVNGTHAAGHRVVAVGTTVMRALETAWDRDRVVPRRGFTGLTLAPGRRIRSVDGLITGLHDPRTSHLALLFAFAGEARVRADYSAAVQERYLWHEFGDSHLIWAAGAG
ncbi:MAG: S-adenosylmethionine:tRNA ribosyltransferase-isomerase [Thermoplasmata archaeon]